MLKYGFQFHKGTIRTILGIRNLTFFLNFNSIKVRLEPDDNFIVQSVFNVNFNSIKVRLEHESLLSKIPYSVFQFHKGTIRTEVGKFVPIDNTNFNSIKVRLELAISS